MESTEPPAARVRPPGVVIAVMAFLVYAGFVALPFHILGPPTGQTLTAVLVTLSFATVFALWLLGLWRLTFHLARATLALWAACGVFAACRMIAAPWFSRCRPGAAGAHPGHHWSLAWALSAGCSICTASAGAAGRSMEGRRQKVEGRRTESENPPTAAILCFRSDLLPFAFSAIPASPPRSPCGTGRAGNRRCA